MSQVKRVLRRRGGPRRNATTSGVSYKEASDDGTGSEDLVEVEWTQEEAAAAAEPDNSETIEKVVAQRTGKVGGM